MSRTERNRLINIRQGIDLRDRVGPPQTARMSVRVFDGGSIPTSVPAVYLTHPVSFDAADTEGASYTTYDDTAVTIPVVCIGPRVPVAGDLLVAHAVGGKWVAGANVGRARVTCIFCRPCELPGKDLSYVYLADPPLSPTSGSGTLTFDGTSEWTSSSFASGYTIDLQCTSGTITPRIMLSGVSQCTFGVPDSTTCNPLTLVYTVPNPSAAYTAGFRILQISDPGPATPCPEPCSCNNCNACGGIAWLPGGTATDDSGSHTLTGVTTQCTATLLSSARPLYNAVGCTSVGTIQVPYHICVACNLDGTVTVTVSMDTDENNLTYARTDCHDTDTDPPTPHCGWIAAPSTPGTQTITPTCSGGFVTGTVSFAPLACEDGSSLPFVTSSVSFSIPYTIDPMCQAFLVVGCNGLGTGMGGAVVSVYDRSGGTLLFTGTTNSGGGIPKRYFDNAANPFWITVTPADPRMQSHAASHTLSCDGTTTIVLSPDSNYVCVSGCAIPIAKTLYATHPTFGAITLVYNASGTLGAGWYAQTSYSYAGCRCCPAKTVTITHFMNTSKVFSDHWNSN